MNVGLLPGDSLDCLILDLNVAERPIDVNCSEGAPPSCVVFLFSQVYIYTHIYILIYKVYIYICMY